MSAISSTSYVLPPRRPWDPSRFNAEPDPTWIEGKVVHGHPNICPLLDFFEDNHYYYLVLPSTTPEIIPNEPPPPSDLFDLVESYPQGLPSALIRSYLGQIADAMTFLHSKGIGKCARFTAWYDSFILSRSSSRYQGRECCPWTCWQVCFDRLWFLRPRQKGWMGYFQWHVSLRSLSLSLP